LVEVQEGNLRLTTSKWSGSVEVQEGNLRLTTSKWSDSVEVQVLDCGEPSSFQLLRIVSIDDATADTAINMAINEGKPGREAIKLYIP